MSGLLAFIPLIFEAVSATVATVSAAASAIGATVFSAASALTAGVGLTGTLGSIVGGALTSAVTGAAIGGLGSLVTGGDFLDGVKNGAIGGAITGGLTSGFSALSGGAGINTGPGVMTDPGATALDPTTLINDSPASGGIAGNLGYTSPLEGDLPFSGFSTGAGAPASAPAASDIARFGSATKYAATAGGNDGGMFGESGIFNNQTVGGLIQGIGAGLSGDNPGAIADSNNQAQLDRQNDQQEYYAGNYSINGGLLPGSAPTGAGRPSPQQAFVPNGEQNRVGEGRWAYEYDPEKHAVVRKPVTA